MGSAPIRKESTTRTASAVRRGATQSGPGSYRVRRAAVADSGEHGQKEVFVETWDVALEARGFDFITFDPDGTFA
jgi:hypothetical protein